MPLFATGLHYSSTGNALEGMQTPSYNATVGMYNRATFIEAVVSVTNQLYP